MSSTRPPDRPAWPLRSSLPMAFLLVGALTLLPLGPSGMAAAEPQPPLDVLTLEEAADYLRVSTTELEALADRREVPGRRIGGHWRFSRAALLAWLGGVDPIAVAAADVPVVIPDGALAEGVAEDEPEEDTPAATDTDPASPRRLADWQLAAMYGTGPEDGVEEESTIGYPPEGKTASEMFLRRHRVLLSPGQLIFEPTVTYSNAEEREFLALETEGLIELNLYESITVRDRIATAALALRYGLFDETEVYLGGRYRRYQSKSTVDFAWGDVDALSEDSRLGTGSVGEMYLGVSRTLLHESRKVPDVILSLQGTIPIYHSSAAIGAKTWLVKSFDPIVLYGGVDYRYTFSRDFDDPNLLKANHRIRATAGYAFSVNDSLTLSTSASATFTDETEFSEVILKSKESYSLRFGLTSLTRGRLFLEPSVTFGLSGPSNWVSFGLTMPWLARSE